MGRSAVHALALAALGVAAGAGAVFAEPPPREWDRESATAYARQLADRAAEFHELVRKQRPDRSLLPLLKDELDLVEQRARHLDERSRSFAAKLAEGRGPD
jgi:hypothetical protein